MNGGIHMLRMNSNKHECSELNQLEINLKPLRKVRLKGSWVPGVLITFLGCMDNLTKVIKSEEFEQEKDGKMISYVTAHSTYLSNTQSRYDQYVSNLYERSGSILKNILVERERVNDQIYLLSKDLARAESILPDDLGETSSVEQKRSIASAKRTIQRTEQEMADKVLELKAIKMQLDEALHQIDELLIQKKNIVTRQKHCYLKGARFVAMTGDLIAVNKESQEKFERLVNRNFSYCIDLEQLIRSENDEKESGEHERV